MLRRPAIPAAALLVLATLAVAWAGRNGPPPLWILEFGLPGSPCPTGRVANVEGVEFVEISPGFFRMGSDRMLDARPVEFIRYRHGDSTGRLSYPLGLSEGVPVGPSHEMPVHWVRFPHGFWIARCEVTNEAYRRLRPGPIEREDLPPHRPACRVRRSDARDWCALLARKSGLPVRLPSESEWECAARAGDSGLERRLAADLAVTHARLIVEAGAEPGSRPRRVHVSPEAVELMSRHAWIGTNSGGHAHDVGTKPPNAFGLYDLYGNVSEWCGDVYADTYVGAPTDGRCRTESGDSDPWAVDPVFARPLYVVRGADWSDWTYSAAGRSGTTEGPGLRTGFRPAFSLAPEEGPLVEPYLVRDR